jgi:hypothetical protein
VTMLAGFVRSEGDQFMATFERLQYLPQALDYRLTLNLGAQDF